MGRLPWTLADFPQGYVLLLHKAPRRAQPSSHLPRRDFYLYGACAVFCRLAFFFFFFFFCFFVFFWTHIIPFLLTSSSSHLYDPPTNLGATDVPSFASPLEFVRHAEWLMRGAHRTLDLRRSPRCTCKYCDLSTTPATRKTTRGGPSSSSRSSSGSPYRKQSVISRELKRVRANVLARIGDGDEEDVEVADAIAEEGEDVDADANADGDADAAVNVDAAGAGTDAGVGTDADADVDAIATTTAAPATTDHDDDGN